MIYDLVVIGGGAAGFFGAIQFKEKHPKSNVVILEKTSKILTKVKVSGGGRCNVTNASTDLDFTLSHYPRGNKELRSVLNSFDNKKTIVWFAKKNIPLKAESDGRMFPITDNSQTIINCFLDACDAYKIEIQINTDVVNFIKKDNIFEIETKTGNFVAKNILLTTGGNTSSYIYDCLKKTDHKIIDLVPSLFTLNIPDKKLLELQGLSIQNVKIQLENSKLNSVGPMLFTHWGLSGPAVLKLSAKAALELFDRKYISNIIINYTAFNSLEETIDYLKKEIAIHSKKLCGTQIHIENCDFPKRFWTYLIQKSGIDEQKQWANVTKNEILILAKLLFQDTYQMQGKTTFKEEFVTAGGISLKDVDMKKMQSKKVAGLYFAGEILNIDGLTGGFNFQSAWSTAYVAANNMEI